MRTGLLLALALLAAGCQPSSDSGAPAEADEGAEPLAVATLRGLTMGDRACNVTLEDAAGETREEMGEFILCEASPMVGQRVRLTYGEIPVPAASCEGDPECADTETVRILTGIERAD